MQTSLLLSLVTHGREGVLRTTTKHMHTIYEEAWQVDAWASTIDCPQRRSKHWRMTGDFGDGKF
jgi:hypothetical protein